MVELLIVLRLEITLIEVVADNESLKRHFGEVCRVCVLADYFGDTNGNRRQINAVPSMIQPH